MKHIARRDLLRGTGVAALAAGAAMLPVGTMATDYATLLRECASKLLTHDPLVTCAERNERKEWRGCSSSSLETSPNRGPRASCPCGSTSKNSAVTWPPFGSTGHEQRNGLSHGHTRGASNNRPVVCARYPILPGGRKRRSTFRIFWNVFPTGDHGTDAVAGGPYSQRCRCRRDFSRQGKSERDRAVVG